MRVALLSDTKTISSGWAWYATDNPLLSPHYQSRRIIRIWNNIKLINLVCFWFFSVFLFSPNYLFLLVSDKKCIFMLSQMIPKICNLSILAQCDLFAVPNFVESAERTAMKTIEPMKESIFQRKLNKEKIWRETYEAVFSSYQYLSPNFSIEYDNFGGYRLVYKGKETVKPLFVSKRNPVGFIRSVPDGIFDNLSIMSSERTGEQLLLLGLIRFVNSDCAPNCEYDFSSDLGIVQLYVRKPIHLGEEIFVKYGDDFLSITNAGVKLAHQP